MDKKQLQQLIIILPIVLIAVIFGYYKYLLSPLNMKNAEIIKELDGIKKEYQQSLGRVARLSKLQQEIAVLDEEIKVMQKKLPPTKDIPGLLRLLAKRLEHYGIRWTRIVPGQQSQKDYYVEQTYTIPFSCSYHTLARFLAEVGQMERIFATRLKTLTPKVDTKLGVAIISGELTFIIYTSKA